MINAIWRESPFVCHSAGVLQACLTVHITLPLAHPHDDPIHLLADVTRADNVMHYLGVTWTAAICPFPS